MFLYVLCGVATAPTNSLYAFYMHRHYSRNQQHLFVDTMFSSTPINLAFIFRSVAALSMLLMATGCNILYAPNTVHVPLFTKKNALQTKVALARGAGVDVSAAYSITDKIALMALGSFNLRESSEEVINSHAHIYGEIAGGRYWHDGVWRMEAYAGAGYGTAEAQWRTSISSSSLQYGYRSRAEYTRLFGQINMGVEGDVLGAGVVLRPTYINFTNFRETENGLSHTTEGRSDALLLEPTAFIRAGMKDVKIELQATLVLLQPQYRRSLRFDIEPFNVSLGVQFHF